MSPGAQQPDPALQYEFLKEAVKDGVRESLQLGNKSLEETIAAVLNKSAKKSDVVSEPEKSPETESEPESEPESGLLSSIPSKGDFENLFGPDSDEPESHNRATGTENVAPAADDAKMNGVLVAHNPIRYFRGIVPSRDAGDRSFAMRRIVPSHYL